MSHKMFGNYPKCRIFEFLRQKQFFLLSFFPYTNVYKCIQTYTKCIQTYINVNKWIQM